MVQPQDLREVDGPILHLLGRLLRALQRALHLTEDRYYVKLQSVEPLHNRGYSIFNQQAVKVRWDLGSWQVFQVVIKDTRAALLKIINQERQGEHIEQDLVKGVIEIFIDLGINSPHLYNTEFEAGEMLLRENRLLARAPGSFSASHQQLLRATSFRLSIAFPKAVCQVGYQKTHSRSTCGKQRQHCMRKSKDVTTISAGSAGVW